MINKLCFRIKKNGNPYCDCYCTKPELIENYDKAVEDLMQTWDCHHRLETHTSDGERRPIDLTIKELIALGMYYNRPPEELIFITKIEHISLHKKGKRLSDEAKRTLSKELKGRILSKEHKSNISKALKGRIFSEEHKRKLSESKKVCGTKPPSQKGTHWYNNGIEDIRCIDCPDDFVPGRLHHK